MKTLIAVCVLLCASVVQAQAPAPFLSVRLAADFGERPLMAGTYICANVPQYLDAAKTKPDKTRYLWETTGPYSSVVSILSNENAKGHWSWWVFITDDKGSVVCTGLIRPTLDFAEQIRCPVYATHHSVRGPIKVITNEEPVRVYTMPNAGIGSGYYVVHPIAGYFTINP